MSVKKTLLIASVVATSFSGNVFAAENVNTTGMIHFKGQFIDSTCQVESIMRIKPKALCS